MKQRFDFQEIIENFNFSGRYLEAAPYGTGHINDTFAAVFQQRNRVNRYILQRVNHNVFKDPAQVMHNVALVTSHMREKILASGGDADRETITLVPTIRGDAYCRTSAGDYWRAYEFIEGARTYLQAEKPAHTYHAAKAFGRFLSLLDDLPAERLFETIPDFHDTPKRLHTFTQAVQQDRANRAASAANEIDFVMRRAARSGIIIDLFERGEMPKRIVHNDAKFDNVLIDDETGEGICVIDLDTVMPGFAVFDFGDAVRSGANTAVEDERDLAKVNFDLAVYDQLVHGFLETAGGVLAAQEIDYLARAAWLITLEQSMRFLGDHLNGDIYYKTQRQNHNLDRTRTQIKLISDMEAQFEQMEAIVDRYR